MSLFIEWCISKSIIHALIDHSKSINLYAIIYSLIVIP